MNDKIPKTDVPGMRIESLQLQHCKRYYQFLNIFTTEVKEYLEGYSFSRARGYLDCAFIYLGLASDDYIRLLDLCDKAEAEYYKDEH